MNLKQKVNLFATTHYKKIDKGDFIDAEYALCNSACHFNSVQAVKAGRADKVWLVWAGGKKGVVHFINSKKGKFFDETWVDCDYHSSYRIIREIKPSEFDDVYDILCNTKKLFINMLGSLLDKFKHRNDIHGTI